jgi:uncharacterized protein
MFKTARYLCLALFVLLFSCVTTGKRYSSDQLASKFYNSVENINNKTLDKNNLNNLLDQATYLKFNSKVNLKESSNAFLLVDRSISDWEKNSFEVVKKNFADFTEYLFVTLGNKGKYEPKPHEITFLSFNLAINHALMGRYDLAAVEVRKIARREEAIERLNKKIYETVQKQEKFNANLGNEARAVYKIEEIGDYPLEEFNSEKVRNMKNSYQNSSANYLSGFIFETQGDISLAAPAYKKAIELNPNNNLYKNSLKNLDKKIGPTSNSKTEVLIIIENGISPELSSKRFPFGVPTATGLRRTTIFLPIIQDNLSTFNDDITIFANESKINLETTTEVDVILTKYLKDSMPKYLSAATTRALIQIASKQAFARALKKSDSGFGQVLGPALMEKIMSSYEPTVRAWGSLPRTIQMARLTLDKGKEYTLKINFGSKSDIIKVNTFKNYQLINIRIVGDEKYYRIENNNINEANNYFESVIKSVKN